MSFVDRLKNGGGRIGVWGIGTIGFSTMAYYAREGIPVLGYDPDALRVDEVNRGAISIPGMSRWLDQDLNPLVRAGLFTATTDIEKVLSDDVLVHFIAAPTEKRGIPWSGCIEAIMTAIAERMIRSSNFRPLLVVESTLTPGSTDQVIEPIFRRHGFELGVDVLLCISPRRDWFKDGGYALRDLDRVYGGYGETSAEEGRKVLAIVCDKLHRATDHRIAELTKVVENGYRYVEISLANQLSMAFPHVNMIEVLRLASTKWNVGLYTPSFRPAGHCIPVAPRYLLAGAEDKESLGIISGAIAGEEDVINSTVERIIAEGCQRVAVLGLSYRAGMKVSIFSATAPLVSRLCSHGIEVVVCDPRYTIHEIENEVSGKGVSLAELGVNFHAVVLATDHDEFLEPSFVERLARSESLTLVVDNYGGWATRAWGGNTSYFRVGDGKLLAAVDSREGHTLRSVRLEESVVQD